VVVELTVLAALVDVPVLAAGAQQLSHAGQQCPAPTPVACSILLKVEWTFAKSLEISCDLLSSTSN